MNPSELNRELELLSEAFRNEVSIYFGEKGIAVHLENINFSVMPRNRENQDLAAITVVGGASEIAVINEVECKINEHGQVVCKIKE